MIEEKYTQEIAPGWLKNKEFANIMAVPRITKVVVNVGVGKAKDNKKEVEAAFEDLKKITGQLPVIRHAKKSIAGFDLREGTPVGVKVTLRGAKMYNFLDKLFNYVIPRVRDFQGLPEGAFDGSGNYNIGLEEQVIFLEIDPNKITKRRGIQITIVTSADNDEDAEKLLRAIGTPIEQVEESK